MAAIARLTGAPSAKGNGWKAINWHAVRREVRRLQIRIAKAVREGRHGRVKTLQWLLTRSFAGKALAVKRVVSNRGRKTPAQGRTLADAEVLAQRLETLDLLHGGENPGR